ncbi:MAG: T9SS type A sorting domain-containing protein, partial [Bacteroidia bacterium]|nr:T9SS type A sorting domain-containing protein [Bacteroidia bacterium]
FGVRSAFASLMKAVNADIYCFQEVYDHDDDELLDLMISLDILDQSQSWYSVKHAPDLITISRYPIVYEQNIGNNSASVLDVDGTELLIVNMHLPCCENDFGREVEIDQVLRFVRRSKDGQLPYQLQDNTPYIFCGDLNLVGHASQLESLINGNINDNSFFGPDVTLDWDDDHMTDLKAPTTGYPAVFTWYSPFSSFFPGRLDFVIYTDSRLEALNRFVLNSQGLNQAEQSAFQINDNSSLITSDHMPVVADFRIKSLDSVADTSYEFEVYPNPAQSILYVRNQIEEIESLIFYDLGGRLLKTIRNPGNRIQLDFEPGLYFMQIHSNSGQSSTRSIVIK